MSDFEKHYEIIVNEGFTPYVKFLVDETTSVPMQYVIDGAIILNISMRSVSNYFYSDEHGLSFSARFNKISHNIYVPTKNIIALFAKETGQGILFQNFGMAEPIKQKSVETQVAPQEQPKPKKPFLTLVK